MSSLIRSAARFALSRIADITMRRDIEYAELQGALVAIGWGVWIYAPARAPFQNSVLFAPLVDTLPIYWWSFLFVLAGVFQASALIVNNISARRAACLAAVVAWLFAAAVLGYGTESSPLIPFILMFALGSAWGYLRIPHVNRH